MVFLFKIEEGFEISGRGCVIVPAIDDGFHDTRMRCHSSSHPRGTY